MSLRWALKELAGLVGLVPVPLADRRSGNPDFTHAAGGGLRVGVRVDDHHAQIADGRSAGHQATSLLRIVGHGLDTVLGQRRVVEGPDGRAAAAPRAADHERRLRQTVAGIEGGGFEAAGGERGGKAFERFGLNGFGADEGQGPAGKIERGTLLVGDLADTKVVGEVGPAGDGCPVLADGGQPGDGVLEERRRRDEKRLSHRRTPGPGRRPPVPCHGTWAARTRRCPRPVCRKPDGWRGCWP